MKKNSFGHFKKFYKTKGILFVSTQGRLTLKGVQFKMYYLDQYHLDFLSKL